MRRPEPRFSRADGGEDPGLPPRPKATAGGKAARRGRSSGGRSVRSTPLVPPRSVSGRALAFVVGIMTFLACLTIGAVTVVAAAAADWSSDVQREMTIQIRPIDGVDMSATLDRAVQVAEETPGVSSAHALTVDETRGLVAPWLGTALSLDDLPVPRLVSVSVSDPAAVDVAAFSERLKAEIRGASLDDHSTWSARLTAMAETLVIVGLVIFILVMVALVLSVVFATRAAIASNQAVIEVLHFVGAENGYIAREFERRFLVLGFRGGLMGGALAGFTFVAVDLVIRGVRGSAEADEILALFGSATVGLNGYLAAFAVVVFVAAITAVTSRLAVHAHLRSLE